MSSEPPRQPKFLTFIVVGAVLGLLVGLWMGSRDPGGPSYVPGMSSANTSAPMFLGAFFAMLGAGAGAVVALLLDRTGRPPSA